MSGITGEDGGGRLVRFPRYDVDAAIEVLGAFITSGIRDEIDSLRRELEEFKGRVDSGPASSPSPEPEEERYLNQREAAEFLGCSTTYIRKQSQLGDFPNPIKLSDRDLRWSLSALKRWAQEREI